MLRKLHKAGLQFRLTSDIINVFPGTAGAKVKLIAFVNHKVRASVEVVAVVEGSNLDATNNQDAFEKAVEKAVKLVLQIDKKLEPNHGMGLDLVFQGTGESGVPKVLRAKGIARTGFDDKETHYAELTEFLPASVENVDKIQDILTKKLFNLIEG